MFWKGLFLGVGASIIASQQTMSAHEHTYIIEQVQAPQAVNVITVEQEPPQDLVEVMDPSPGVDYVWQKGCWRWNGSWVWVRGEWTRRPHGYTSYVPGYWRQRTHHHHHWEWVEPQWR